MKESEKQIGFDKKLLVWGETFSDLKNEYEKVKEELRDEKGDTKICGWNDVCKEFQYTNNKFWRKEL